MTAMLSCAAVTSSVGDMQEGAVADEHHHPRVGVRVGEPDAHPGRDLVAHAGEPELQVAEPALGRVPHLLQVPGRPAGGGDDRVAGPGVLLHQADDLALGEQRAGVRDDVREVGGDRGAVERGVRVQRGGPHRLPALHRRRGPGPATPAGLVYPAAATASASAARARLASPTMPVAPRRCGVVAVDVDRRELHVRVLEQRLRRGREVGQPRADGEHEVGLADQVVVRRGALQTDPAELPPGPLLHRALAGHGLQHRDAGRAGERLQLRGGVGVDDAATGDDDRLLRAGQQPGDGLDLVRVGDGAADHPVALGEELGREVERVATGRPGAATAPRRRCPPGRSARAWRRAAR